MGAPLLDRLVKNTLVKFVPESLDTLAQLVDIVDLHLIGLPFSAKAKANVEVMFFPRRLAMHV